MRFIPVILCSLLICSCAANRELSGISKQSSNGSDYREAMTYYVKIIHDKIQHNAKALVPNLVADNVQRNIEVSFRVSLSSTGNVEAVKIIKPSGVVPYDVAMERAIYKSSPLPISRDPILNKEFRLFILNFRPY